MDHTRPLSRASSALINARSGAGALARGAITGKKRTREESDAANTSSAIRIRSLSDSSPDLELLPLTIIPRARLALACLDVQASNEQAYPRLFRGRIAALESRRNGVEAVDDQATQTHLLLAQDTVSSRLFAIEAVRDNVFALCRLQKWVSLGTLSVPRAQTTASSVKVDAQAEHWWTPVDRSTLSRPEVSKVAQPLRSRFTMKPRLEAPADKTLEHSTAESQPNSEAPSTTAPAPDASNTAPEPEKATPADLQAAIKLHYLDSFYINRTPLAYFAKGPLSRARASLKDDHLQLQQLIEYLRSHVMSLTVGNKKYDTTLAELIRDIPGGLSIDDLEHHVATPIQDRIRKSRKRKQMSKGGLLPGEEDYVLRWWIKREEALMSADTDDSRDARIKTGLADLRAREMQLQIVLILEILALEASVHGHPDPAPPTNDPNEPNASEQPAAPAPAPAPTPAKKKKPIDLKTLLDILIDRLCIWESMHSDTPQKPTATTTHASEGSRKRKGAPGTATTSDTDTDRLRDFCTEVIVPYYATRLPELYLSICQKLGGPSMPSPPGMKTPALKRQKPGAAVSRGALKRQKSSAADGGAGGAGGASGASAAEAAGTAGTGAGAGKAPASKRSTTGLARSATDSQLPALKRELSASSLSLSNIPRHRPSLQESRRFTQREVDLSSITAATEAKLAKKAIADRELKNAIAALRRPNARLAVKDYVESNEQHKAAQSGNGKGRKARPPMRNPFAATDVSAVQAQSQPQVQVSATPKVSRQRMAYTLPPPIRAGSARPRSRTAAAHAAAAGLGARDDGNERGEHHEGEYDAVPPSSEPRVPSSSIKPASTALAHAYSHTHAHAFAHSHAHAPAAILQETPQRAAPLSIAAHGLASGAGGGGSAGAGAGAGTGAGAGAGAETDAETDAEAPIDATPSRRRAKVVPARRPSTCLSAAVPEIVRPAHAHGPGRDAASARARHQPDSSPRLPALFRTPVKPARARVRAAAGAGAGAGVPSFTSRLDGDACAGLNAWEAPARGHGEKGEKGGKGGWSVQREQGEKGDEGEEDGAGREREVTRVGDTPAKMPVLPSALASTEASVRDAMPPPSVARDGIDGPVSIDEKHCGVMNEVRRDVQRTLQQAVPKPETDIYAALGWDDEDYELGF